MYVEFEIANALLWLWKIVVAVLAADITKTNK